MEWNQPSPLTLSKKVNEHTSQNVKLLLYVDCPISNHVIREHEFHFLFRLDQLLFSFSPVTYKVLHLLNGFSGYL